MSPRSDELKIGDLPDNMQEMADLIGLGNVIKLMEQWGGEYLYIPRLGYGGRAGLKARDRRIIKGFDGKNYAELARKYGLTKIRIRQIVGDHRRSSEKV